MSSQLLWATLSIVFAEATVPTAKVPLERPAPLLPPVKPVKPVLPVTETEGAEKEPKMWVKYVAVPDVKHGSNDTIFAYRSGNNLGCGKMEDGQSNFFRIVGGKTGRVPWQVAVLRRQDNGVNINDLFCGGSILDETHILTAAHCTLPDPVTGQPPKLDVLIGKLDFKAPANGESRHKVQKIIDHPKYVRKTFDYDFSILELNCHDAIDLNGNSPASPVCLPEKGDYKRYMKAKAYTVSGWGDQSEGGKKSNLLQVLNVPPVKDEVCAKQYPGKITSQMVCAGFPEGGRDACQSDSGGPLTWLDPKTQTRKLIGVVSFGKGCARAGKSGVYSKVEIVLSWIKNNAGKCAIR